MDFQCKKKKGLKYVTSSVANVIQHHRQTLEPKADMHHLCNVQLIEKTIRETLSSLSNLHLPIDLLTEDIQQELGHVEKIMQQSQDSRPRDHPVAKKEKRPALNVEDPLDFGNWEDDWEADQEL